MNDISNGLISISKELQISPGFQFEQFKKRSIIKIRME